MAKRKPMKPRTFTIPVELDKTVELLVKEMNERSYSSALCEIIRKYIATLDYNVQRRLTLAVAEALFEQGGTKIIPVMPAVTAITICPACNDTQNVVNYPDGRWRCNLCMAEGKQ